MELLTAIGTALTAGGTGGLLGVLGGIASGWMKTRAAAVELEREKMRFEQQMAMLKFKAERAATQADLSALTAGIQAESRTNEKVSPWVADVKSLWRPALTLFLLLLTSLIFYAVLSGNTNLSPETASDIIYKISAGVIFLANLSVSFWFASRGVSPDRTTK